MELWAHLSALLVGIACGAAALSTSGVPPQPPPRGGLRALRRQATIARHPVYRPVEALLLRAGGLMRTACMACLRPMPALETRLKRAVAAQEQLLTLAGEPLGLDPWTFWATSLVVACGSAAMAWTLGYFNWAPPLVGPAAFIGLLAPHLRLATLRLERFRRVSRELPLCIDLVVLAMSAGADFPGAVECVKVGQKGVVAEEFALLLHALKLGLTRRAALHALERRAPVREVRDLVRAMALAEDKGASVADALRHLSQASRQRRSVRAEEAAARAGVLLVLPLMILLASVMILLVGPLVVSGLGL